MSDKSANLLVCIPRLRRYARALAGSREAADDLVQDTLERAWTRLASWREGSDMRAWLFAIMHNLYVDRARRPATPLEALDDNTPEPYVHGSPADRMEIRDMETALRLLPAEQREVLLLVALESMSYDEVGATLGIPIGTVMSRLSRGRERLRLLMDGGAAVSTLKVVK
jgi:RNA polymerase sigma factor (sigma-70 family)